jgi:hypothetical protein
LRRVDVQPIGNLHAWIEETTQEIADKQKRSSVAEILRDALRDDDRPQVPRFPDGWRSAPTVMFEPDDSVPQQLLWGAPAWETDEKYGEELR